MKKKNFIQILNFHLNLYLKKKMHYKKLLKDIQPYAW